MHQLGTMSPQFSVLLIERNILRCYSVEPDLTGIALTCFDNPKEPQKDSGYKAKVLRPRISGLRKLRGVAFKHVALSHSGILLQHFWKQYLAKLAAACRLWQPAESS